MSAKETVPTQPPAEKITLDDLKDRVDKVKNLTVSETKRVSADVLETNAARTLMIVAGVVVVAASFAFYLGSTTRPRPLPPV